MDLEGLEESEHGVGWLGGSSSDQRCSSELGELPPLSAKAVLALLRTLAPRTEGRSWC